MPDCVASPEMEQANSARIEFLVQEVERLVNTGEYALRSRVPSERVLSEQYGIPVHLVRAALSRLEQKGVVYRIRRSGTFVRGAFSPGERETPQKAPPVRCINIIEQLWPFPSFQTFIVNSHLMGYTEALENSDVKTRFCAMPAEATAYESLLSPLFPFSEQGCIIVSMTPVGLMSWLKGCGIPYVVQHYYNYEEAGLPEHHRVFINRNNGILKAIRYLMDLGHREIGFIGNVSGKQVSALRYGGFEAAMIFAGLSARPEHMVDLLKDVPELAEEPAKGLLARPSRPTAVIAQTDAMAIGVMKAARSLGIKVPEELSVVGFNDQPEAATSDPPLTTLAAPRRLAAKRAMELLLGVCSGTYVTTQTVIIECDMVVRNSASRVSAGSKVSLLKAEGGADMK